MSSGDAGIVRVQHDKDHTYVMLNKKLTENAELSYGARGLMSYLLSKPDDWQVRMTDLERQSKDGRQRVRTLMKELEIAGYVQRKRIHNQQGRVVVVTTVLESPRPGECEPLTAPQSTKGEEPKATNQGREANLGNAADIPSNDLPSNEPSPLSGVPDNPARSRATPKVSAQTSAHRQCRKVVTEHFKRKTGLRIPEGGGKKGIATTWWNPVRVMCEEANWDSKAACQLVDEALASLEGMTIAEPISILKTVKARAAKARLRASPPTRKQGVVYPDGTSEILEVGS